MERIIYAGDSTVTFNKIATYPQTGLSQGLSLYLKDDVFVRSFAINGRSTKSFIDEGRFQQVDDYLQKGDFLFIQFGHNDEKVQDKDRYTRPFNEFQDNLKAFIEMARRHEAKPVILTPIARRLFDEAGKFMPGSHGEYPKAALELAEREGVPAIDLTTVSENYLMTVGDFPSRRLYVYPKDNSHLVMEGAMVMAGFIADGLLKLGSPYSDLLVSRDAVVIDDDVRPAVMPFNVHEVGDAPDLTLNLDKVFAKETKD